MKNLFERESVEEIISRIDKLQPAAERRWGKMDVAQMMAHCSAAMDMASGRLNMPRVFLGRLLGPFVKPIYTNEKPLSRNSPTAKQLVFSDQRDFAGEQEQLRLKVRQFHEGGEAKCTRHPHPFFGALTPQEWSRGMYKHLDHHLRQFGA
jgi:transposase InsO family protein